ncbi:MAG: ATP-binding protein [Gammaproteobacteria bacterium]|nr:ATP-binding protein [Gammaproteobacteria bacterium]MDH5801346.1 ATP-binding protein [Gammaproteobacteria bacterium]
MPSLTARVLIVASIVLISFFGLVGLTLERAYYSTTEEALKDRLAGQIYALIATTEVKEQGVYMPDPVPEALYFLAGPELYAQISQVGDKTPVWRSSSLATGELGFIADLQRNERYFSYSTSQQNGKAFAMLSHGVAWDDSLNPQRYVYSVAEDLTVFRKKISAFRYNLWGWLCAVGLLFLLVQGGIIKWGLAPLQSAAAELSAIEQGRQMLLQREYPVDLKGLTDNLNALLGHQQEHLERYRHTLGDLAHSLKTPLAVLQSTIEKTTDLPELKQVVQDQLDRMNQITEYQLQRAAAAGKTPLVAPVNVDVVVHKIINSLMKVYNRKKVITEVKVTSGAVFHGDEGDLMEVAGNLLDNAFKWCDSKVAIRISSLGEADTTNPLAENGILIVVEDDGLGIPDRKIKQVIQRGVRADQGVHGHGIGLSVVQDIVHIYGGELRLGRSELGGARVAASLSTH